MTATSPPSAGPAVRPSAFAGLDACVHCGFCLPACPTYEVTSDEADSPRGRIVLMHALVRGELPPEDDGLALHLDRCLGCRACESVCPSGVVFGPALEAAGLASETGRRPAAMAPMTSTASPKLITTAVTVRREATTRLYSRTPAAVAREKRRAGARSPIARAWLL